MQNYLIYTLSQFLNYKLSLQRQSYILLSHVMSEITEIANNGYDNWLTRVSDMEKILKLPWLHLSKTSGKKTISLLKSEFDRFWLDKMSEVKLGPENNNHNKLRTYGTLFRHG